ncbi:hypothetical protein [Porphyromonas sp. COT-239 OH1446]|uniref:hypothetical protein n=1 Tax=Porphyromonas sp. COT-239 OH1446 TaxID=1515613 RepID=UPI00052DBEE8|nr:hypothetical protein [Porphyromonas sp. COT-239 OH1446]KGN68403.1 hypothetical protein HQ37_06370 [Porphyromonas sp. COT-239 OH1446]
MAVGLVLSACSKDKDTPQPVKENFVMIDGQRLEIKLVEAEHEPDPAPGRRSLIVYFQFSEEYADHFLLVEGNSAELHGKTIDLTKLNEKADWRFRYCKRDEGGNIFILESSNKQVFSSGSLYTTVDRSTLDTEINLTNGKLTYEGKEHTISLYYKGKARPCSD